MPAIAYLDASQAIDPASIEPLEVERPTRVGDVTVEPLVAQPSRGVWVVELIPAG